MEELEADAQSSRTGAGVARESNPDGGVSQEIVAEKAPSRCESLWRMQTEKNLPKRMDVDRSYNSALPPRPCGWQTRPHRREAARTPSTNT